VLPGSLGKNSWRRRQTGNPGVLDGVADRPANHNSAQDDKRFEEMGTAAASGYDNASATIALA
jgi:hypothetical protein